MYCLKQTRMTWCRRHWLHQFGNSVARMNQLMYTPSCNTRTLPAAGGMLRGESKNDYQFRHVSVGASKGKLIVQRLHERGLVRVAGTDATNFLQGLLTNDVQLLERGDTASLYAMMLNVQGRTLYDLILYKAENEAYFIECDQDVTSEFLKTMKRYKIRKKVNLADVGDEYQVWAAFPSDVPDGEAWMPEITAIHPESVVSCVADPRLQYLGNRLILKQGQQGPAVLSNAMDSPDPALYDMRRYQLGVGEGTIDLPPGQCLPLEGNIVFLNGVSFDKGCYIGQELTARTHHTGVIRKRLMPLVLQSDSHSAKPGDNMENSGGKSCGKFRNAVSRYGLGLVRIVETVSTGGLLTVKNTDNKTVGQFTTHIPFWWPKDSDEILKQAMSQVAK